MCCECYRGMTVMARNCKEGRREIVIDARKTLVKNLPKLDKVVVTDCVKCWKLILCLYNQLFALFHYVFKFLTL